MKARFSNSMMKLSTFFAFLSLSAVTNAGTGTGLVSSVTLSEFASGTVYIQLIMSEKTGQPSCATWSNSFVREYNSPQGKAFYAALLAAKSGNKTVKVVGSGDCLAGTSAEKIMSLTF